MNHPTTMPAWPATRLRQKRFLLLSPNNVLFTELKQLLLPQGYSVSQAHNIAEAHDMLAMLRFDLLLLDSCLLHTNIAITEQITSLVRTAQTALLIIQTETDADASIDHAVFTLNSISGWVNYGCLAQELLPRIEHCLQHRHLLTPPPEQSHNAALLDEQVLSRITRNTTPELLSLFLSEFTQEMGQRQQQINQFFQQQEWSKLRYEAHALKGIAGNFGAMQLYELAAQLEHYAQQLNGSALANLVIQMNRLVEQTVEAVTLYLNRR